MNNFTSTVFAYRKNSFKSFVATLGLLAIMLFGNNAYAQPSVLGSQVVNGSYSTTDLVGLSGTFKQIRLQATSSASSGTRNWEFASGTAAATNYNPNWRPYSGGNTLSVNTYIPVGFANGARYNTGGGASGLLPTITSGNYYTFNVSNNATSDNVMQLLETSFNPATISSVTQSPVGGNLLSTQAATITVTTSSAPASGENVFVRYTTNSYTSSTLVQLSFTGATGTATIPAQASGATVSYYIFSSNKSLSAINSDVSTYGQTSYDMSTLTLNNNAGSNYSYTVTANNILVTSTGGSSTSATYATLAAAITAINGGIIHTGTIVCTVNDGYTETAPAGGYSITATGTAGNTITFTRSNSGGSRPILTASAQTAGNLNDAIFKIIGGDYITIDGFTMLERNFTPVAADTAAATNTMTEFGVALFYTSTTNGVQNCTIQNNVITLNRTYQNTFGIYSNSTHSATNMTTSATATTTAGANNNTKIYGNTISNVNIGVVIVGPTGSTDLNTGIDIGGTGGIQANTISNFGTTGTFSGYANLSGTVYGIIVRNSIGYNISFNNITSSVGGVTSGTLRGIFNQSASNAPTGTFTNNINSNAISLTYGVATGTLQGITVEATTGTATSTQNINSNNFTALTASIATSATITAISDAMPNLNTTISSNTFTNLSTNTTGSFTFISNPISVPATGGTQTISNNTIVTAFNKTGAGGTVTFFSSNSSSVAGSIINCLNNNLSNITVTGATSFVGINNTDGGSPTKTITGNVFNNITGGTGLINPMTVNFFGGSTSSVSSNTFTNINWGAAITALTIGGTNNATTLNVNSNIINTISSTGTVIGISNATIQLSNMNNNQINTLSSTASGTNIGLSYSGTSTCTISKNKIYNISGSNASTLINGILVSNGTIVNVDNNYIGNLTAPASGSATAISGINITGGTTANVYYNTVRIDGTSSGALFGTSAIFASTTPTVNLRNNIFVNVSVPTGAGLNVAYRRSGTTLTTYASTSNNNLFYAGTPSATNLIFNDGTNSDQTLANFKTRVSTRDANSISENAPFLNTTGSAPTFLHIDTTVATGIESGAATISGYTTDYDGDTRNATTPDIGADEGAFTSLPAPVITSLGATSGCQGTSLVVTGTNMNGVTSATIGGTAAAVTATTATTATLTVGSGTTGTVTVTSTAGSSTSAASFTVNPAPTTAWAATTAAVCTSSSAQTTTLAYSATTNSPTSYSITWSPTPTNSFVAVSNQTFAGTAGGGTITINVPASTAVGTYTGTITNTNANSCTSAGTQTFTVVVYQAPTGVTATATPTTLCTGSPINLTSSYTTTSIVNGMSTYTATRTTGTAYTSIIPATNITTWRNSASTDDNLSDNQPIGFSFKYNNIAYSTFRVSTNGFITFDNTSSATGAGSSAYGYVNNWSLASSGLVVAPNWDDLQTAGNLGTLADLNGSINYTTSGTTGSRITTVEWKNMQDYNASSTASYNWQVKLYESDNHIEFVYGTMNQSATAGSLSSSTGLSAATVNATPTAAQLLSQNAVNSSSFGFTNQNSLGDVPSGSSTISFVPAFPIYSWTGPNGFTSSLANPTISSATVAASGIYNLVVSNSVTGCSSAQASTASVTVNPTLVASVSINASATTICAGTSVTFTATPTNGGTPTYQWQVNGTNVSGQTASTFTTTTLANNDSVTVVMTSTASPCLTGSPATSNAIVITVNPTPNGNLTNGGAVCAGTQPQLTFTSTAGTAPFTLVINGQTYNSVASGVAFTATGTAPTTTTTYTVTSITGVNCSNPSPTASTSVTVNPLPTGNLTNGGAVCAGTQPQLTFTSTAGTAPFTLVINGQTYNSVASGVAFTATGTAPTTTTTYTVSSITGVNCSNPSPTASTSVTVNPTPTASISGNNGPTICSGSDATFTLTGTSGGVVSYNINGGATTTVTLTGGTATVTIAGVTANQTLNLISITSSGCTAALSGSSTVSIGGTTTWTAASGGSWDNGAPIAGVTAIISYNYTSAGDLNACSLTVNNNAVVLISSGNNVMLYGALTVTSGSLTLSNNANLLQTTNATNSGNIIVKRNSSALKRLDYTLWSTPVASQNLLAFSPLTQTTRFYNYNTATNLYNAVASPSTTNFALGQGYLIRMPNNHPTFATVWPGQFTGVPNNGNVAFTMTNAGVSGQKFNAVGNPYPSTVDMASFVAGNSSNITGSLYFWRKTNSTITNAGYSTWTAGTFVSNGEAQNVDPQGILQVGQGFLVEASGNATALSFSNSMRVANNNNQFFKSNATASTNIVERDRLWLNMTSAVGEFAQTAVCYVTDATNGVDAFDGKYFNDGPIAFNSYLNTTDYAIQGRALPFDIADVVPMSYKVTNAGTYTVAIDHKDGLFSGATQDVFLKDNTNSTYTNLNTSSYTFASDAGSFNNRFELVYQAALTTVTPVFNTNSVVVYKNNTDVVINTGTLAMSTVKIFDIRGRLLASKSNINATETRMNVGTTNEVLLVQVTSIEGSTITKKVIN